MERGRTSLESLKNLLNKDVDINLDTVVQRSDKLATANISGEICMFNIDRGKYYNLDSIGSRIWELVETSQSIRNIISILIDEYEVEGKTCEDDILEFMQNLYTEGIVCVKEENF